MKITKSFKLEKNVDRIGSDNMSKIRGGNVDTIEDGGGGLTFRKYWTAGNGEVSQIGRWDPERD